RTPITISGTACGKRSLTAATLPPAPSRNRGPLAGHTSPPCGPFAPRAIERRALYVAGRGHPGAARSTSRIPRSSGSPRAPLGARRVARRPRAHPGRHPRPHAPPRDEAGADREEGRAHQIGGGDADVLEQGQGGRRGEDAGEAPGGGGDPEHSAL